MSKNKNKIRVRFIGRNADDVTGSCILIEMQKYKILLECGLYQSNNVRDDYKVNSRKLEFKPHDINYIFINHGHIDHIGLLPRLYANGCKAKIIAPKYTSDMFAIMGADSAYIMSKDVLTLKRKYGMDVSPIYTAEDVSNSLQYFDEYEMHDIVKLNDEISFRFIPSGHIINAGQLELWLTEGNRTVKMLYTSDLGNISIEKHYIEKFEPVDKANLVIAESTYANEVRSSSKKDRDKDIEKIESVISTVCQINKHKVLIPVFSLDRCQNVLTMLYEIFGQDENFKIPILIDSPLAIKLTRLYEKMLDGDDLALYRKVINWKNIQWIEEYENSKRWQSSKEPCVILASSGFMTAGRSRLWAKVLLPDSLSHILFVGYSSENSLAGKIKRGKHQKTISIDKEVIPNRCGITDLKSFSSHIQNSDMLNYYSSINCEKIALVHGDFNEKIEFGNKLQEEISKKNRSAKVTIVNKTTELLI